MSLEHRIKKVLQKRAYDPTYGFMDDVYKARGSMANVSDMKEAGRNSKITESTPTKNIGLSSSGFAERNAKPVDAKPVGNTVENSVGDTKKLRSKANGVVGKVKTYGKKALTGTSSLIRKHPYIVLGATLGSGVVGGYALSSINKNNIQKTAADEEFLRGLNRRSTVTSDGLDRVELDRVDLDRVDLDRLRGSGQGNPSAIRRGLNSVRDSISRNPYIYLGMATGVTAAGLGAYAYNKNKERKKA